jgi:hypothetical protein
MTPNGSLDGGCGATDNGAMTLHAHRLPFSLHPLMAEAKRRMRKRRVLILVLAVVVGGGVAGAAIALNTSGGFQSAAVCPGASAYVYAVPSYPAQAPPGPAWPPSHGDYWGWMARRHPFKVGDTVRVDTGGVWQIKAIAALPNDCQFMGLDAIGGRLPGGSVSGRLVLGPVSHG